MTYEEFKKEMISDLLSWISKSEREPRHWALSVEDWAKERWNYEYQKAEKKK